MRQIPMQFRLRTLLIVVSYAALCCGNWVAVFDTLRPGRLNLVQLLIVIAAWGIAMPAFHLPFWQRRIS